MIWTWIAVAFVGIISGGIVNLLADDLPKRRPPRFPPRYSDDTPRPAIAWLGLTAFFFGKRRAPDGTRLRWRYPLTELMTAGLMLLAVVSTADDPNMTPVQLVFWLIYMVIFSLITVIDLEHRLILFIVIIPSSVIALLDAVVTDYGASLSEALIGGALGFGVFFLLYIGGFIFVYVSGKLRGHATDEVAFGYGDVMLMTLCGFILGWQALIPTMFLTVFLGAFGALIWLTGRLLTRGGYSLFTPLPYGQYIVIAAILLLLFATEITTFLRQPV